MFIKNIARTCLAGFLIFQLGFSIKPCNSLSSNFVETKDFPGIFNYKLKGVSENKSYRITITENKNENKSFEVESEMDQENKIKHAISISASKYGIDEKLIKSLIKQESNFDPNCVSSAGAVGLMQIMPNTIEKFDVQDPYDIYENIDAGSRHLKGMIERYEGNIVKAIAAYNCGGNALDESGFQSLDDTSMLPKETRIHVTKIFDYYYN